MVCDPARAFRFSRRVPPRSTNAPFHSETEPPQPVLRSVGHALGNACKVGPTFKVVVQQAAKSEKQLLGGLPGHPEPTGRTPLGFVGESLIWVSGARAVDLRRLAGKQDPDGNTLS